MLRSKYVSLVALVFSHAVAGGAAAQSPFEEAFEACRKVSDNERRLACYDALQSSDSQSSVFEKSVKSPENFGLERKIAREQSMSPSQEMSVSSGLLEAGKNRTGQYFFILENGQVWRQLPSDSTRVYIPKKLDGVTVTIKRKSLGSHILTLKGRSMRVSRLK